MLPSVLGITLGTLGFLENWNSGSLPPGTRRPTPGTLSDWKRTTSKWLEVAETIFAAFPHASIYDGQQRVRKVMLHSDWAKAMDKEQYKNSLLALFQQSVVGLDNAKKATLVNFIDTTRGNMNFLGQAVLTQPHGLEEVFLQYLARGNGRKVSVTFTHIHAS